MNGFDLQLFAEGEAPQAPEADSAQQEQEQEQEQSGGVLSGEQSQQQGGGVLSGQEQQQEQKQEAQGGAPEQYEAFNVPEGVTVDEQAMQDFTSLAKELNLSQASAQKLIDFQTQFQTAAAAKLQQEIDKATQAENNAWKEETLKTFKPEEIQDAVRGFRSAPKEVQQILAAGGYDNHKAFVEFFRDVGRAIKEDKFETGRAGQKEKSAANVLYPDLN